MAQANVIVRAILDFRRAQLLDADGPAESGGRLFEHEADDGIGAAERLEAAETEAEALVLDVQCTDPQFAGHRRHGVQRRLGMVVAKTQEALDLVGGGKPKRCGIGRVEIGKVVRVCVEDEHLRYLAMRG